MPMKAIIFKFVGCSHLLIALILNTSSYSQDFTFNQGGTGTKNYYVEIPYEISNGRIFVYPKIAGTKHKFIFDTGSTTTISNELAKSSQTSIITSGTNKDVNGISGRVDIVKIEEISFENLSFNNIPAIIFSPQLLTCLGVEGSVGSNLLRNSIVKIDNERHVIILTDQISN